MKHQVIVPDATRPMPRYAAHILGRLSDLIDGRLLVELPDGRLVELGGARPGPDAFMTVHNGDLFARIVRRGSLGFAEAYMDGDWSTPDLQTLMDLLFAQIGRIETAQPGMRLVRAAENLRFLMQTNRKAQARRNIERHYDLGNEFYARWLDPTMTYSAGIFDGPDMSLTDAQARKYQRIIDELGVKPGDHVLEIGCGWGGFAEHAALRGLRVTGLTISRAQHEFACQRVARLGLGHLVDIRLEDYRDHRGSYDGVASIEMFEAVGERYWQPYFDALAHRLNPGARAVMQVITMDESRFPAYRLRVDFIQKYIFPGGMLPTATLMRKHAARAGLAERDVFRFGQDYARTLKLWHRAFNACWPAISEMGFDARFKRMWNLYLTSCAASFESGNSDLVQITIERPS